MGRSEEGRVKWSGAKLPSLVETTQCEEETPNVEKKLSHVMLELHNVRMKPLNVRKKLSHVMLELHNVRMKPSSVRKK